MVEIGKYNTLKIVKDLDFGVYLDGGNGVEILLPTRYVPKNVKPGDEVEVFIYHDNEGRLIATTARPLATVGEFQFMEVKDVNNAGAFLEAMKTQGGYIPVRDKSDPDVIYSLFRCSKIALKQAICGLNKEHLFTLEDGGIRLVNEK